MFTEVLFVTLQSYDRKTTAREGRGSGFEARVASPG